MGTGPASRGRQGVDKSSGFAPIAERFRRGGDLERAVQLCREGLTQFPDHLSGRVTLGWALLDLGRYDEARTELELVLRKAPDNLAAIRGLAELHDRAESTMLLDVEAPGPWPPEGAAIEEDTSAADSAPDIPAETMEAYEKAIAPSESFAAIAAAASAVVEPAAEADSGLEAAIADLDAQAEALVASRTQEDPPPPVVAVEPTVETPVTDPLAEFAAAMAETPAPVAEAAAIEHVQIETPAAASMAEATRAAEEAAAALEALEAEEALKALAIEEVAAPPAVAESPVAAVPAAVVAPPPVIAPEPVELSAAEIAAAQHADRVADESMAAFAAAEAHAATHAASFTEQSASAAPAIEADPEPLRDADVMRIEAAEPPAFAAPGLDEFVQAHEASVDLAEEVAAFAAAIEPAAVEPQITRAIDVQYDHSADDGPAIDLVPADAEMAIAGAERLAADLVAGAHADVAADDPAHDTHAADAFAAMQDLSAGGRLIEPLTHERGHDADDAADTSSVFDHDVPNTSAFANDVLSSAVQAREAAASYEAADREHAAHSMSSAFADARAEDWTPPTVQETPVPAPPPAPAPVFAAVVEAASDFVPADVAETAVEDPHEPPGSIAARATVYDTPVPSVETPVTPIDAPKPKKGRTAAPRRPSPVASLEKMLRRVQARRQVVSESVA